MACPNINSQQWKDLVSAIGVREAYREFLKYGEIPNAGAYPQSFAGVNATLKVVGALNTPKMQQVYTKFYESNPDKFYAELQNNGATKAQIQLLREWNTKNQPQSLEAMVTGIAAEMSYTVEINEATESKTYTQHTNELWELGIQSDMDDAEGMEESWNMANSLSGPTPTSHYSSLTVPGGTNYRENEIRTPAITAAIKGHAGFATEKGIGWFRSDDRTEQVTMMTAPNNERPDEQVETIFNLPAVIRTRRILEVQSDLFQRGRDYEFLTQIDDKKEIKFSTKFADYTIHPAGNVTVKHENGYVEHIDPRAIGGRDDENLIKQAVEDYKRTLLGPKESFLKLLSKDNNWVTFFVKSIIQDSTRKGYEQVLFPAGDTANKIEGQGTIEDYIKYREANIKHLRALQEDAPTSKSVHAEGWRELNYSIPASEDNSGGTLRILEYNGEITSKEYASNDDGQWDDLGNTFDVTDMIATAGQPTIKTTNIRGVHTKNVRTKEDIEREIQQYEKEIADAKEGRSKFAAINRFYENDIQNILKKQGYSPVRITDEYGNDWFQVDTKEQYKDTVYFNKDTDRAVLRSLHAKGLIDEQGNIIAGNSTISENTRILLDIAKGLFDQYGYDVINVGDGKVSVNSSRKAFDTDTENVDRVKEATSQILAKLKANTGVDYEVVTDEKAQELLGDLYTPDSLAFFKDGKVYIIDTNISPNVAFHEYAHPFVYAIYSHNPALYNSLIEQLKNSPEGSKLIAQLKPYYSYHTNEEALVRAIEAAAFGDLKFESPEGKSFWSKLWFTIKQLFRRVFGQHINLETLGPNTTLQELSSILLNEKIDLRDEYEKLDYYVLFNRDIAQEMTNIPEHEAMKSIESFHRIAQDHLTKLRENKNYAQLREVLKNQADGSILNDISKLLNLSKEKEQELDDNFKQLNNFARAVVGAGILSDKMKAHVVEMSKADMDERDKLRTMRYYSFISNDWLQAFEQLREINKDDLPLLGTEIQKAKNNFQRINDLIAKAFKGGLVATFRDNLSLINENMDKELTPEIDRVKALVDAGNAKLQSRLDYLQKMKAHGTFDDEKILKLLQGELGDTNFFSALLESYTSSPDPIVGGFAAFVNKELYKVEAGIQEFNTKLGNDLAPLYKQYGVDTSKPEELGQQLVFKEVAFTKDGESNPKGHEVYTYLHEFGNGYQYDYQLLQHKIDEAKEAGNREEAIKLQKEFDQLKKDYFHREYLDEVYAVREFWNESDINRIAQQRRKEITDQLASYEAESNFKDLEDTDREHIDELLRQLRVLSSTKNMDGSDKEGEDLAVAQAIQEYNSRMWKYREEMPMKGAFERDLQTAKDDLLDKGFAEGSPEYKAGLNAWLEENLRIRLSEQFYTDRDKITDEIAAIVNQLPKDEARQLDVSKAWKEMFEQVKGFRDQDNQPIGSALSTDKIREVKKVQEHINEVTAELRRLSGLTGAESERYSELWGKLKAGQRLDGSESAEFDQLNKTKDIMGLNADGKNRLMALFEELKEFQSKIPTEYYIEAFNQKLNESGMDETMSYETAEEFLAQMPQLIVDLQGTPIGKWFEQNHILRSKWNSTTGQHENSYERLYVWNRIVPNDEVFKNALANNDYQTLLKIKNKYVDIRPAQKYFFYRIKNEFRTRRIVGQTIDNKGNWLPKTVAKGAKDDKYANKRYFELRNSKDPKQQALYQILETYKKYHLQVQEEAPKYTRLWYELPRIRKEKIENIEALASQPLRTGKNVISWVGSKLGWKSKPDAFDNSLASKKDLQDETKMYVATDLFGNEINSIPMRYMSRLDTDTVSLDIGRSTIKYALALQINKTLHEINPFAQALKQTLAQEGIKSVNKVSKQNWLSKFSNIPVLDRDNKRLKAINNMVERDIEGVENKMELGLFGSKVAQHLMGVAAFGSLAMNLPAGVKNVVVAKFQNLTESVSNEFFSAKNLKQADQVFMNRFMPKLIKDYNSFSGRSLETQMFELFDFVQGKFEEHVGESFSASWKKDIAKLRFTRSFQSLGELQAQGQAGLAMLIKQQVPWTHNGTTTMIKYLDAWEMKEGVIQLKEGVDQSWGKNGSNFASFKLKMHKINELMQGAYAKMNQSEATRYTAFKMINFMRRYLVPGITNRFTVNRNNFALGTQREGYYVTPFRLGADMAKNGIKNWHHYSDKEKRNVYKTLTEMGYSLGFLMLMGLMGYNSDDPDKNKKLKDNSWAFNMALYEVVMIKGELENFIPFPGMGMNEILRMKDQPSIAFPLLNKYYKIISHLIDLIEQPFSDYDMIHYKRNTGIYQKGDLKIWSDLLKAIGYTGATMHPDVAIKNYMATTNRYN